MQAMALVAAAVLLLAAGMVAFHAAEQTGLVSLGPDKLTEEGMGVAESFIRELPEFQQNGREIALQRLLPSACPIEDCRAFDYTFGTDAGVYNITIMVKAGRVSQVSFNGMAEAG
jgi:hypothetical protein